MYYKCFYFVITCLIMVHKEVDSNQDRTHQIANNGFAELLNSIIKINQARVGAISKYASLSDFNVAKNLLRSSEVRGPTDLLALLVGKASENEDDLEVINAKDLFEAVSDDSSTHNSLEESQEKLYELFEDDTRSLRIKPIKPLNFSSSESSNEVFSSEIKQINPDDQYLSDSSSSELPARPQILRIINTSCGGWGGYKKCQKACKEAYRSSCSFSTCSRSLYRRLRKECKKSCHKQFKR